MGPCPLFRQALLSTVVTVVVGGSTAHSQTVPRTGTISRSSVVDSVILSQVKAPPEFDVTVFAGPPVAMYPTCLTAAPDGALFVCVDPNLSLSTDKGRGRIMRLVDTDADGRADRYSVFAEMDSPRGVVSDGKVVYVMHPPVLTAYRDTTGDGIADASEDLVRGLGFDLGFRGADHTTNGVTMGIDGWLYIAVGDYGFRNAVGKDGTTIQHRGGGVVRVRPDGTGLEIYAVGTRNIYDVAIDPLLHVFSRDNTNDGDGWDTRLHYLPPGANMGYPSLYKNFSDEHMPSLADYGAGAGTGALWVHDPGFPAGFDNMLYTGDWTLNKVFRHPMEPKGASFAVQQQEFLTIPHPADMAMDGRSNMYVASLSGGQFTYSGDTVGYVVRVSPRGRAATAPYTPASLSDMRLVDMVLSASSEDRLQAQREMLRRDVVPIGAFSLRSAMDDTRKPPFARVAAMFTYLQLVGRKSHADISRIASRDPIMRAAAFRALTDDKRQLGRTDQPMTWAIADSNPSVQLEAVNSLVRLRAVGSTDWLRALTGNSDPAVAHAAINALVTLQARDAALKALDSQSPQGRVGALRALQQMHDSATVSALIERVDRPYEPAIRHALIGALARLYHREAPWTGDWWGTQPSFVGPYFAPVPWSESARIAPVLRRTLLASKGSDFALITDALVRNRVLPAGAKMVLLGVDATSDTRLRADVITALVGNARLDSTAIALLPSLDARSADLHAAVAGLLAAEGGIDRRAFPLVRRAVLDTTLRGEVRGALLASINRLPGDSGLAIAAELAGQLNPVTGNAAEVEAAWRRFVGDRRRANELDYFIAMARTGRPEQRTLAYAVLVQSIRGARTAPAVRDKVAPVIASAWSDAAAAPRLVEAITIMRLESQYAEQLRAYRRVPEE